MTYSMLAMKTFESIGPELTTFLGVVEYSTRWVPEMIAAFHLWLQI